MIKLTMTEYDLAALVVLVPVSCMLAHCHCLSGHFNIPEPSKELEVTPVLCLQC